MSQYFCNYLLDLLPLEHKHKSPPTRNQHKPPNQQFLPRAKTKRRSNTTLKPGKRRPQVEQVRKKKKIYIYIYIYVYDEKTEKYNTNEKTR